jgi:hypothetical protein
VILAQQQTIAAQHATMAAQESMRTARQDAITAQQDANETTMAAQQQETFYHQAANEISFYQSVISELIFRIRTAVHNWPRVLPIRVHCPGTPYPNAEDTEYIGPSRPRNDRQEMAIEISSAISDAVHRIARH